MSNIINARLYALEAFSFQDLGARLSGYCSEVFRETSNIRIISLFSDSDGGKGNAVLSLFKQFASFPLDIPYTKDCRKVFDDVDVKNHSGITIIICSTPMTQDACIPEVIANKTTEFRKYLSDKNNEIPGKIIFLSGVSVLEENPDNGRFPLANLIPLYLLIRDRDKPMRTYRQPELGHLLKHLNQAPPAIEDLDRLVNSHR